MFPFTPGGAGVQQALLLTIFAHNPGTGAFSVGQQIATAILSSAIGFAALVLIFRFTGFREVMARAREHRRREGLVAREGAVAEGAVTEGAVAPNDRARWRDRRPDGGPTGPLSRPRASLRARSCRGSPVRSPCRWPARRRTAGPAAPRSVTPPRCPAGR